MKTFLFIFVLLLAAMATASELRSQWVVQDGGAIGELTDVVMLDTSTAIAVGRADEILRTTNSGETWSLQVAPLSFVRPWNGISFSDSAHGIVVGDSSYVLMTSAGGETWTVRSIPTGEKCLSALQTGPASAWVGTDSGWVYSTSDTGKTWSAERISEWPIRSLFAYRGQPVVGVSKFALTPFSLCTQYVMPLPSWNEKVLPPLTGLGSEAYDAEFSKGEGPGFIVGVGGDFISLPLILRKTETDTSWLPVPVGIPEAGMLFGVSAPSASVIYACGTGGLLYRSMNGGDTWVKQDVPTTRNIRAIYFFDETHGFAVGDSGLILHTTNGGVTDVEDEGAIPPEGFLLRQNYPNPFNPSTTIQFETPRQAYVTLRVFDVLGREVATLVDEVLPAGRHRVVWNAMGAANGVYFCRMEAGTRAETIRLMLAK